MAGFFFLLFLIVIGLAIWRVVSSRSRARVHDAEGRRLFPTTAGEVARWVAGVAIPIFLLLVVATSIRVVAVGQALVIFNTVTRGFRVAQQGITFIPPFICSTAKYDLRRLEYTMSGVSGEGRKSNIDDSIWSPTKEGLTVGIDLTAWHHIDPKRLIHIHQDIGQDYEEKIIRPAVRSMIRLVISEYAVMDVYSAKRALIQDEINTKIKALIEKDGFIVDEVVLRDVRFPPDFAKAIEAKQIAQQGAEQMRYTLEKEQREAERKVIEARGRATAIEVISRSLAQNPDYIRYLYVDKLADDVSVIVSDQATIMDLKGILERKRK